MVSERVAAPPVEPGNALVPVDCDRLARDQGTVQRGFWRKVRALLGRVPFVEDAVAAYYCAIDPATPRYVQAVLFGALAYFVTPVDAIPDFIAALGYTDDAVLLLAALRAVRAHLTDRHYRRAHAALSDKERR
jgi:uncharacterized membrane protein YkvA (DUF1232 family)